MGQPLNLYDNFMRGVKRDASLFPTLSPSH